MTHLEDAPHHWPPFLSQPDPTRDAREWARDAYAQRGAPDRPFTLNFGYGEQVFTIDDAFEWAERIADERLP